MTITQTTVKDRAFPHTLQALVAYDRTHQARRVRWEKAQSMADVIAAEAADLEALVLVQQAFWEDTKDINSRENCGRIDAASMRRIASKSAVQFDTALA